MFLLFNYDLVDIKIYVKNVLYVKSHKTWHFLFRQHIWLNICHLCLLNHIYEKDAFRFSTCTKDMGEKHFHKI